jgi:hypothetical protein
MTEERPRMDERDPAAVVQDMVRAVIRLAKTWPERDGRPRRKDDRLYTPHKSLRRVGDHLIDHLAEVDCRIAGEESPPDRWHASSMTTPADLAPFTEDDLDEAISRLERLALLWTRRLQVLTQAELDARLEDEWTIREVAFHLEESTYYAEAMGDLTVKEELDH